VDGRRTGDDSIGLEDILAGPRGPRARDHRPRLVGEPRRRRPRQPVLRLPRVTAVCAWRLARRRALVAAARLRLAAGDRRAIVVSVTARGSGEIALTYYGTPDKGDALGATGMNWRAWMTYSPNALAAEPGLPLGADLARVGADHGGAMPGCCTTEQTFLEYTGVKFTGRSARSAAPSPAGRASTCPSSCSRSCDSPTAPRPAARDAGSCCTSAAACAVRRSPRTAGAFVSAAGRATATSSSTCAAAVLARWS
jgi:hypothetical protein